MVAVVAANDYAATPNDEKPLTRRRIWRILEEKESPRKFSGRTIGGPSVTFRRHR